MTTVGLDRLRAQIRAAMNQYEASVDENGDPVATSAQHREFRARCQDAAVKDVGRRRARGEGCQR